MVVHAHAAAASCASPRDFLENMLKALPVPRGERVGKSKMGLGRHGFEVTPKAHHWFAVKGSFLRVSFSGAKCLVFEM